MTIISSRRRSDRQAAEPVRALAAAGPRGQGGGDRRRLCDGARTCRVLLGARAVGRALRDPIRDLAVQHLLLADLRCGAPLPDLGLQELLQAIARPGLAPLRA